MWSLSLTAHHPLSGGPWRALDQLLQIVPNHAPRTHPEVTQPRRTFCTHRRVKSYCGPLTMSKLSTAYPLARRAFDKPPAPE
eukprot:4789199-Lingulodinium_polyedra.AAC.1